jgi:hypothetical protein
MGYVIAGVLVILIIAGFIAFLVMNSMKKSDLSDAHDPGADQNPLSMVGSDDSTPAGDTSEHAGEQTAEGRTVSDQDADEHGGTGAPPERFGRGGGSDRADVARPVVGGEGEGERSVP